MGLGKKTMQGVMFLVLAATGQGWAEVAAFWQAVDHAQGRHPHIHRREADLRAAMETRPQRGAKFLPSAHFQVAKTLDEEIWYQKLGTSSTNRATVAKVTVNQSLVHEANRLSFEQGHEVVDGARAELEAVRQDIALQVATAVSNWLQAKEVLELAQSYQQVTQHHFDITGLRFRAGESTETDVQQSRSRADQAVSSLAEARNTVDQSRAAFFELVGEYPNPAISLPLLDWNMEEELQAQEKTGFVERADVQAAQAKLREADLAIDVRRAENWPTVDLTFNASRTWDMQLGGTSGRSLTDQMDNRSLLLTFNLPLFNGGENMSRLRQSIAQREGSLADYELAQKQAQREAQQARADVVHHRSSYQSLDLALASSKAALAGLEEEFLVGTRTLLDLLDAQYEVFTLQTNLVRHRYQEQLGRLRLWKALGRSLQNESQGVIARHDAGDKEMFVQVKHQVPEGKSLPERFPPLSDGPFLVQVATFGKAEEATILEEALMKEGIPYWRDVVRVPDGSHVLRLLVGPFADYEQVLEARDYLDRSLAVTSGWIPNPAWKNGMTASYWREDRQIKQKRMGRGYGMARMR